MDDPASLDLAAAGRSSAVELILQAAQQIDSEERQWIATTTSCSSLAGAAAAEAEANCTGSPGTSTSIAPGLACAAEKNSIGGKTLNSKKQPLAYTNNVFAAAAAAAAAAASRAATSTARHSTAMQRRHSRSKSCDDSAEEDTDTDSDSDVYAMEDVSNGSGNSSSTSKLRRRSSPDAELKSKQVHNSNERNRRKKLKESVHRLRNQLTKKTKRATMISVLKAGQQEIKELCLLQDSQEKILSKLKEEHCYLEWKLKNLLSEHKEKAKLQQHNGPINGTVFDFQLPQLQVESNSTFSATGSSLHPPPFSHIPTHTPLPLNPSLFQPPHLFPLYGMLSSPYAQQCAVAASTNSHQHCPLPFHYPPYYTHSSYRSPPLLNSLLPSQLMVNYCPTPSSPPIHPSVIQGPNNSSMSDLHHSVVTSAANTLASSSSEEDAEEVNVDSDTDSCVAEPPAAPLSESLSSMVPVCSKDSGTVSCASHLVERISGQTLLSGSHSLLRQQQHSHNRPRNASDSALMETNSFRAQYSVTASHRISKDRHHITGTTAHQVGRSKSVERMTHQSSSSPTPRDTKNSFEQERELIVCS